MKKKQNLKKIEMVKIDGFVSNSQKALFLKDFLQQRFDAYKKFIQTEKYKNAKKSTVDNEKNDIIKANMALTDFYYFCCQHKDEYNIYDIDDVKYISILYVLFLLKKKFTSHSIYSFTTIINYVFSNKNNSLFNGSIIKNQNLRNEINNRIKELDKNTKKAKDRKGMKRFKESKYRQIF